MDGKSWYINNLTSLAIYYLTNIFFLVFLQLNLSIICFCKCKIYCFCLPRTVAFIAVAMFLRSNTYALRPSLCVGIPRQININSLTQGHCEGRPSVGLGTRMGLWVRECFTTRPIPSSSPGPSSGGPHSGPGSGCWAVDCDWLFCSKGMLRVGRKCGLTINNGWREEWQLFI